MPKTLFLLLITALHYSFADSSKFQIINDECPFSRNSINPSHTFTYGVCCSNCFKKASANVGEFIKKTKPNNTKCSFSAKPVKKRFLVGFCCSKCKKRASL